jgi:hypothetical protein
MWSQIGQLSKCSLTLRRKENLMVNGLGITNLQISLPSLNVI